MRTTFFPKCKTHYITALTLFPSAFQNFLLRLTEPATSVWKSSFPIWQSRKAARAMERKALLAEKKELPVYHVKRHKALAEYAELKTQAADIAPVELYEVRQAVRPAQEKAAEDRH